MKPTNSRLNILNLAAVMFVTAAIVVAVINWLVTVDCDIKAEILDMDTNVYGLACYVRVDGVNIPIDEYMRKRRWKSK